MPDERAEWESHAARLLRERDAALAEVERLRGFLEQGARSGSLCCEYHAEQFERELHAEIDHRDKEIAEAHKLTASALAERDRETGRAAQLEARLGEALRLLAAAQIEVRVLAKRIDDLELAERGKESFWDSDKSKHVLCTTNPAGGRRK